MSEKKRLLIGSNVYGRSNGVYRSVTATVEVLRLRGWEVMIIHPKGMYEAEWSHALDLGQFEPGRIRDIYDEFRPTHLHLANEGHIPMWIRDMAISRRVPFSTSFTTLYDVSLSGKVSARNVWEYLHSFHSVAARTFVPANWLRRILRSKGFPNLHLWPRGVDSTHYSPRERREPLKPPVLLTVGRVVKEKNLDLLLDPGLSGTKVIIGDGPHLEVLKSLAAGRQDVKFLGNMEPQDLPYWYSQADAFYFGNAFDTFGNVLLESLACGTPIFGPPSKAGLNLLKDRPQLGILERDVKKSLSLTLERASRNACREFALGMSWERATDQFESGLVRIR